MGRPFPLRPGTDRRNTPILGADRTAAIEPDRGRDGALQIGAMRWTYRLTPSRSISICGRGSAILVTASPIMSGTRMLIALAAFAASRIFAFFHTRSITSPRCAPCRPARPFHHAARDRADRARQPDLDAHRRHCRPEPKARAHRAAGRAIPCRLPGKSSVSRGGIPDRHPTNSIPTSGFRR